MQIPFVNLRRQHEILLEEVQAAMKDLIASNQFMGGEVVRDFERDFAQYLGVEYVVSCANATDALEIVLRAWNIKPGDEVIVPANGWMSATEAVRILGATPIMVDNHSDNYNINLSALREKISLRTKAIVPIHLYGNPVDMTVLSKVASLQGVKTLEDCAQAQGASVNARKVGSWGDAGVYSFYPTKNLGAMGDGGAIVTNDSILAKHCRAIASHGQFEKHTHRILGRNSRMDALQARILSAKLPHLDRWNQRRQQIARYYSEAWQDLPVQLPINNDEAVWHLFVIQTNHRDVVREDLAKCGIQTEIHYLIPVCQQPLFQEFRDSEGYPNAEQQAPRLLSIPLYPELTDLEVEYIAETFRKVIERVARQHQPSR